MPTPRRHRPLYPVLAALALGGVVAGCGVGADEPVTQDRQLIVQADAGTRPTTQQPDSNQFVGGGAPYEAFDAGPNGN